jgi:hypothetical protein
MAWYIRHRFCDDERYGPSFTLEDQAVYMPIFAPLRKGDRVDPVPELVARRRGQHDYVLGPIPDFLTIASQHVASDGFRRVVEDLEPGVHQFIPVTLYDRGDVAVGRPYWVVNPQVTLDVELKGARVTELRLAGRAPSREEAIELFGSNFIYAERSAIAGRHFWRGSRSFQTDLYFSDELVRRVRRARLRKLTPSRVIEI